MSRLKDLTMLDTVRKTATAALAFVQVESVDRRALRDILTLVTGANGGRTRWSLDRRLQQVKRMRVVADMRRRTDGRR